MRTDEAECSMLPEELLCGLWGALLEVLLGALTEVREGLGQVAGAEHMHRICSAVGSPPL